MAFAFGKKLSLGLGGAAIALSSVLALAHDGGGSVSSRLGGFQGILDFLENRAVPAVLADPQLAPFFAHLTENASDLEECLAMLLDHDLGGPSQHNGGVTTTGHVCRSSMSNIHRGLEIPDAIVTRFIQVVGHEAAVAGISQADITEVGHVLDRYRGGVRNK